MAGFIYRAAAAVKDFGERHKIGFIVRLGLWVREQVMKLPAKYF